MGQALIPPPHQLLESDQELYRNFPLTISERWQQEVTETVFDTVNADTDKQEARKKAKNKQLGHEEGEWGQVSPAPSLVSTGTAQRWQCLALNLSPVLRGPQTTPWARTASYMGTCPSWATPF